MKRQAGIKFAGRDINNVTYIDATILMGESDEEPNNLLMWVKQESLKNWLKTQLPKN